MYTAKWSFPPGQNGGNYGCASSVPTSWDVLWRDYWEGGSSTTDASTRSILSGTRWLPSRSYSVKSRKRTFLKIFDIARTEVVSFQLLLSWKSHSYSMWKEHGLPSLGKYRLDRSYLWRCWPEDIYRANPGKFLDPSLDDSRRRAHRLQLASRTRLYLL